MSGAREALQFWAKEDILCPFGSEAVVPVALCRVRMMVALGKAQGFLHPDQEEGPQTGSKWHELHLHLLEVSMGLLDCHAT